MNPTGLVVTIILLLWSVGGTIWLLTQRRYTLVQLPRFAMDLLGFPVELAQSVWGRGGVPYALLLPNMLIFGFFTFLPMILNFWVSVTGGESISLLSRPFVGIANYADIFNCQNFFSPNTCSNAGQSFWVAMGNTLLFVAIQVPVLCVVALATALVVNMSIAGRGFWRAMFFYPVMLSPVVIANIWQWVLHRRGILNDTIGDTSTVITNLAGRAGFDIVMTIIVAVLLLLLSERTLRSRAEPSLLWGSFFAILIALVFAWANPISLVGPAFDGWSFWVGAAFAAGLVWMIASEHSLARVAIVALGVLSVLLLLSIQFDAVFDFGRHRPINWLVTPNTGWPFFWLVFVFTWSHMGFYMLILLAGLQAIPKDLYEAAKMDAAKPARVFFRITFPLLMPTFTVVVVLALIRGFQVFDEVYLLTGGGPGRETFMVVQNIYEEAFQGENPNYGEAAAGSVLMAVVIAIFTGIQLYATRRQSDL